MLEVHQPLAVRLPRAFQTDPSWHEAYWYRIQAPGFLQSKYRHSGWRIPNINCVAGKQICRNYSHGHDMGFFRGVDAEVSTNARFVDAKVELLRHRNRKSRDLHRSSRPSCACASRTSASNTTGSKLERNSRSLRLIVLSMAGCARALVRRVLPVRNSA